MILPLLLAAALTVPHTAVINGEQWSILEVKKVQDNPTLLGWTDCRTHIIEILKSEPDAEKADTIIHETLHALTCEGGRVHNEKYDSSDEGHKGIYFAGKHLAEFLHDNPEIVRFIMEAGIDKK